MDTTQHRTTPGPSARRTVAVAAAALTLVALSAVPSSASQDSGRVAGSHAWAHVGPCHLERIGTQFVRCDDLTGNGVPAPAHIRAQ